MVEHARGRVLEFRVADGDWSRVVLCPQLCRRQKEDAARRYDSPREFADAQAQDPLRRRVVFMGDINFAASQAGNAGAAWRRPDRILESVLAR